MMIEKITYPFRQMIIDKSLSIDVIFFSILLICLPRVLITGPALPDIFLSLISLFLIKSVKHKFWNYYKTQFFLFFNFSFYGIIRSLFSDMPMASLANEGSVFYFRYIFFALVFGTF